MEKTKLGFEDFLAAVEGDNRAFVAQLHEELTARGCNIEVKEAKSGFVVSYTLDKKTVMNYVFRKAGPMIRILANHVGQYMDFLETLPDGMIQTIEAASVCKRLVNPEDCNSRCAMGYDFVLRGKRWQKCRSNAFMFRLCAQYNVYIEAFVRKELDACG